MAKKKGFNDYKICGAYTIIYVKQNNGNILESKIDTEDLNKLKELGFRWNANINCHKYYLRTTEYFGSENGKQKCGIYYLHLLLMGIKKGDGKIVDHISTDSLDNRKNNLRVTTVRVNSRNRVKENINNTSGYRNVSYIKSEDAYLVQLQINNKNTRLGKFKDVNEAGAFAKLMREKYYGTRENMHIISQ